MPIIDTKRGKLWIADHRRDAAAAPAIFVHGAGGSHLSFPKEMRRQESLNPILIDLPGHGGSPGGGHDEIGAYGLDVLALMDALKIDVATIVGHSMGGAIALWLAIHHPERVSAIVLIGSGARLPVNPALIDGIVSDTENTIGNIVRWMWAASAPNDLRQQSAEIMRATAPDVMRKDLIACSRLRCPRVACGNFGSRANHCWRKR